MSTSIRTLLRAAVKTCLLEIKTSSGYNNTILRVFDPPVNMEQMTEYPSVNILWGDERRQGNVKAGSSQIADILLPVQFDVFLLAGEDTSVAQDNALSDLQRYFGINYYIQPAGDTRKAFEIIYNGCSVWGTDRTSPNCGLSVDFDVYYSMRLNDPSIMT